MAAEIQKFFYLTFNQFLIAIALSIVLFLFQFTPVILRILSGAPATDASGDYMHYTLSYQATIFVDGINSIPLAANIMTAIVWGLAGLIIYTVIYLLANILVDTRNEILYAADSSAEGASTSEILRHAGGKLGAAIGYLLFVGVSLSYLLGFWMDLYSKFVFSEFQLVKIPFLLGGFVGLTLNIYLISVLAFLIWKFNESKNNV